MLGTSERSFPPLETDAPTFLYPLDPETARKPVARRNETLQRSSREDTLFLEERVRSPSMSFESLGEPTVAQYWSDDGCPTLPAKQVGDQKIGDPNSTATRWRYASILMPTMSQETANRTPTELYCDVCAVAFRGRYAKGNLAQKESTYKRSWD
jgi:hypothetical protein